MLSIAYLCHGCHAVMVCTALKGRVLLFLRRPTLFWEGRNIILMALEGQVWGGKVTSSLLMFTYCWQWPSSLQFLMNHDDAHPCLRPCCQPSDTGASVQRLGLSWSGGGCDQNRVSDDRGDHDFSWHCSKSSLTDTGRVWTLVMVTIRIIPPWPQ